MLRTACILISIKNIDMHILESLKHWRLCHRYLWCILIIMQFCKEFLSHESGLCRLIVWILCLQTVESSPSGDGGGEDVRLSQLVNFFMRIFLIFIHAALFLTWHWFLTVFECFDCLTFVFPLQNLIDLAGSESSKAETTGLRRKEGSYINKSLLTLGTVSYHFPYVALITSYSFNWWPYLILLHLDALIMMLFNCCLQLKITLCLEVSNGLYW